MNSSLKLVLFSTLILLTAFSSTHAGEVTIPNTFASDTPAVAAEVNANFTAVKTAVDDNNSRVAALEALVTALQSRLEALETSQVMALESYLTVDEATDPRGPLVQLSSVNLQIVNGLGGTDTVNGLGNLIVGYDEVNTNTGSNRCSDGAYSDQATCEGAGAVWSYTHKTGSHYLVLGSENSYSQFGGLVAGQRNFTTRNYATVTGGYMNLASGEYSSISGGQVNFSTGAYSSVSGGGANSASGDFSSISGGHQSIASGDYSSISGGNYNQATGDNASVSGGRSNTASGWESSVGAGYENEASGRLSSVQGGRTNDAIGDYSSVGGGYNNTASGIRSSVSGGETTGATGADDWAAASLYEDD
jgi:hypothetical protein